MTTMLPVMCAVNMPRLRNPIRSTMPAMALSKGGSHRADRKGGAASGEAPAPACLVVDSRVDMADSFVTYDVVFGTFSRTSPRMHVGTMSPKLIAKIMSMATEPSASVAPMSSHVLGTPWV